MDTAEDTSKRQMASVNGFHSGLASATIFGNEDVVSGPFSVIDLGKKRERMERLAGGEGVLELGVAVASGVRAGFVELNRCNIRPCL